MEKKTVENRNPWLACVAKENYDNFQRVFGEAKHYFSGKKPVIFGAGIMGLQFCLFLHEAGVDQVLFCDNDKEKWNKEINGVRVISPDELKGKINEYYVFLVMERYEACAKQLVELGYRGIEMWQTVTNFSEHTLLDKFMSDEDATVIVFGDCAATTVSVFEDEKTSLEEMIYCKNEVKTLSLNSMYMRTYYSFLLFQMERMRYLKKVVVLFDLGIFHDKYPLLQKTQHVSVIERMKELSGVVNDEIDEFLEESRRREKNDNAFGGYSPNRKDDLSEIKLEQERKMHMRLNYLYQLKEDTESIKYLDLFVQTCVNAGVEMLGVIMPINYALGEKYFGNRFYELYEPIRNEIIQHIEKMGGKVMDASYFIDEEDFIAIRSTNEGLMYSGRKKLADNINRFI